MVILGTLLYCLQRICSVLNLVIFNAVYLNKIPSLRRVFFLYLHDAKWLVLFN
jgi:hypothetical protein